MGIFPSVETLLAQLVLVILFAFALVKTFWPSRSVSLPIMPPSDAGSEGVATRLTQLERRIDAIEQGINELSVRD